MRDAALIVQFEWVRLLRFSAQKNNEKCTFLAPQIAAENFNRIHEAFEILRCVGCPASYADTPPVSGCKMRPRPSLYLIRLCVPAARRQASCSALADRKAPPPWHQRRPPTCVRRADGFRLAAPSAACSSPQKKQIYDTYGWEGLNAGMELGPHLRTRDEIRAEFERKEREKARAPSARLRSLLRTWLW